MPAPASGSTRAIAPFAATQSPFALLDDSHASAAHPRSRLYTQWHSSLVCDDVAALDDWQHQLQQALADGWHAVLLADYEWGLALHGLPFTPHPARPAWRPALRAELFRSLAHLTQAEVDAWLAASSPGQPSPQAGLLAWQPNVERAAFDQHLADIHAAIARGDTYQINYTFAFEGLAYGSPLAIYRELRQRQSAEFGALIHLPQPGADGAWILSLSPELFIDVRGTHITARPMKGTASAGDSEAQAQAAAHWLHHDTKNRAENVMIVDLLRNDLGRIARTGSVAVQDVFAVQRNGGVLSMTSTVKAELPPGTGIADVLRSVFPCGSITGAPKRKTMELIAQIEGGEDRGNAPAQRHHRGVYTGAIGWAALADSAPEAAHPASNASRPLDYCLSVPIRTVLLDDAQSQTSAGAAPHRVRLPVGAGIVWDSQADDEWRECHLKARFATQQMSGFELFETMRLPAGAAMPAHWDRHAARVLASAQALGFAHDEAAWPRCVQDYIAAQSTGAARPDWRLRLALRDDGTITLSHGELHPLPPGPVWLQLADAPCRTPAWLRRHKTTLRTDYDAAMQAAQAAGAFDCLFFNEQGHLTEGARTNVFVRLDDAAGAPWLTPPIDDDVLPGVMRSVLLQDPAWQVQQASLSRAQLLAAKAIVVTNSLRGVLPARLNAA